MNRWATPASLVALVLLSFPITGHAAKPLTDRELTDRYDAGREVQWQVCKFRKLPEIRLLTSSSQVRGEFKVRPKENDQVLLNELEVQVKPTNVQYPMTTITVSSDAHTGAEITTAVLSVGSEVFRFRPNHSSSHRTGEAKAYEKYVVVEIDKDAVFPALQKATSARLVLQAKGGAEVSSWNFDVERLRYLRRALELSHWKCSP